MTNTVSNLFGAYFYPRFLKRYGELLPTVLDLSGLEKKTGGVHLYTTDKNNTEVSSQQDV